jgi:hypothetical protein
MGDHSGAIHFQPFPKFGLRYGWDEKPKKLTAEATQGRRHPLF